MSTLKAGTFSISRNAPSFTPTAQYYVTGPNINARLVNWSGGTMDGDGNITDNFNSPDNSITMSVRGLINSGPANVFINGAGAGSMSAGSFTPSGGYTLEVQETNITTPLFVGSSVLYVNNSEYDFVGAYDDNWGNRVDIYTNNSLGTLTLAGTTNNSTAANVSLSYYSGSYSGYYSYGNFSVGGLTIATTYTPPTTTTCNGTTTTPPCNGTTTTTTCNGTVTPPPPAVPVYGPDAFWLAGQFYARTSDTSQNQFQAPDNSTVTLTGGDYWSLSFTAKSANGTTIYTGSFNQNVNTCGLFTVTQSTTGAITPVCPASRYSDTSDTLNLSGASLPQNCPPALMVQNGTIYQFLGTTTDPSSGYATAWYANGADASNTYPTTGGGCLLGILVSGSSYAVTLTSYMAPGGPTVSTGTYSPTTYLFQTGTSSSLPMPIVAVDPSNNDMPWNLAQPAAGSNLPATFLVRGDVWRYAGTDSNGNALYQGYYYDGSNNAQIMTVDAPDANGQQLVIVSDSINGSTTGVFNSARGSARLRDGEVVYSGNNTGSLVNLANSTAPKLQTIAADLDITGNVISFGALQGDAEAAGVTLQFTDDGSIGTLTSALGRPLAQWVWSRADPSSLEAPALPVMKLDKDNGLMLYDQALSGGSPPGVTLNPKSDGVSSIAGVLRVRPGGDIPMGNYTAVPQGLTPP